MINRFDRIIASQTFWTDLKLTELQRLLLALPKTVIAITWRSRIPAKDSIRRLAQGLGLISMRERVKPLRGDLRVSSVLNQGTEIVIWLPLLVVEVEVAFNRGRRVGNI